MNLPPLASRAPIGLAVLLLATVAGCFGRGGPKTYPVNGRVELAGGKVQHLAGHVVEVALLSNPKVRAYGEIAGDGSFALETLAGGVISRGAVEGKYQARIVLSDDDPEARSQAAEAVNFRFLQFESSGLTIDVPAREDVVLPLSHR